MSNKRIQKKRAKAEMLRDKSKVIAHLVVLMEPGLTRHKYLKRAKRLWEMDMDALFDLSFKVMRYQYIRSLPMLKIIPRNGELVNWRAITSDFSYTEVK